MEKTIYSAAPVEPLARTMPRAGTAVGAVPVLFLLFDSAIKLAVIQPVVESFAQLGWPVHVAAGLGLLELVCVALYMVPRTAVLGAILLTGYLGGAIATHVRVENPLFTHILFPVYVALLLWGGLYLREPGLRALVPVRG